eukprot:SAG31_NODE_3950_length_3724_cov_3.097655_1_plen_936_part_00
MAAPHHDRSLPSSCAAGTKEPLRVAVRVRPLLPRDGPRGELLVDDANGIVRLDSTSYAFDRAFGAGSTQNAVTRHYAAPLVSKLFDGIHGCLFAFGQTGAGKTYSMLGADGGQRRASQDGVLPQITTDIFRRVAALEEAAAASANSSQYQLRVSFVEIYRERVYDLLCGNRKALSLRERQDGSVYAEGTTEVPVHSTRQMLDCVAAGSAARATAATGMHEHSSRSHAVLTLVLEHRWREVKAIVGQKQLVKMKHAQLSLVDLAGSEDMQRSHAGSGDASGIATNLGLHALTRVLAALADNAPHIPYRDATLTRLLQPALGGDCATQMLACVSPSEADEAETERTLRWAAMARGLSNVTKVHVTEEVDTDPMAGDVDDPSALQRRCLWLDLPSCAGLNGEPIFARCAGDSSDPLVLYVHGSGPRNSSMFWNGLVEEVASLCPGLFHVAIDCPGYGRSPGDRQTIRSYPGALLSAIIRACGKRSAAALVGSSQGACAVFNALLECPRLAASVAVCHPVGHAVERYIAVQQPALLIFDTEDAGHPVEVGRRMKTYLPRCTYYEFTPSVDGLWDQQHMPAALVKLLQSTSALSVKSRRKEIKCNLPELSTLAGGLYGWQQLHDNEIEWMGWGSQVVEEDRFENTTGTATTAVSVMPAVKRERLFSDDDASEDEDEVAARIAAAAKEQREAELGQTGCELCGKGLGTSPVRLTSCRHLLCASCCGWSLRHFLHCPLCEAVVKREKRSGKPSKLKKSLPPPSNDGASITLQSKTGRLPPIMPPPKPEEVLVLEYGNTATRCGSKTKFATFVSVLGGEKTAIKKVSFNINPDYSKPTATLSAANGRGWTFEYAMARPYPCFVRIDWSHAVGLPPLVLEYYVQDDKQKFCRRLAIELPESKVTAASKRRVQKEIVLEEENATCNGWFLRDGGIWSWRGVNAME